MWFQKTSILIPWKVIGNSEGVGCLKAKVLKKEKKYKAKLEYPEGWGSVQIKKTDSKCPQDSTIHVVLKSQLFVYLSTVDM